MIYRVQYKSREISQGTIVIIQASKGGVAVYKDKN
jgi:hypothetical protein